MPEEVLALAQKCSQLTKMSDFAGGFSTKKQVIKHLHGWSIYADERSCDVKDSLCDNSQAK